MKPKRKLKKSVKDTIFYILFSITILIFIASLLDIVFWFNDNKKTEHLETDLIKKVEVKEIKDNEQTEVIKTDSIESTSPYWTYIKMNLIDVDFNKLKKINNNVKGWIQVGGTNINYPFLQTIDNEYYLTHSFDNSYNQAGWVFMDYRNNLETNKNSIFYAHSRLDKSMFGSLNNVIKDSWLNNTDNHIIKLSNEEENTLWQVFSVYKIPETDDYLQVYFPSDTEFLNFSNKLKDRSIYNFNTNLDTNDRILTLSTCYSDTERIVLHAKLIKRNAI